MGKDNSIVILEGARRTPRADILIDNKKPGLFCASRPPSSAVWPSRRSSQTLPSIRGSSAMSSWVWRSRVTAIPFTERRRMRPRGGLGQDVPALTVARIRGSGAEAVTVGAEMMLAGLRHDEARLSRSWGVGRACSIPSSYYNYRGPRRHGYSEVRTRRCEGLPPGSHLQDSLLTGLHPSRRRNGDGQHSRRAGPTVRDD